MQKQHLPAPRGAANGTGWGRRSAALALAAGVLTVVPQAARAAAPVDTTPTSVIVQAVPARSADAEAAVARLGGHVNRELGIVGGFAATVPASRLAALSADSAVSAVTRDAHIQLFNIGGYDNVADVNSVYNVTRMTGAQAFWSNGYTGQGVDVALIDTGVVPVNGLTAAGKVINGPDLSFDSQVPQLANYDGYGHGTHMAGIIAGRDDAAVGGAYVRDSSDFIGMAPDARILNVRVGDHSGAADVSQVIAAIDWVVQHRTDNGLNVRVLNLSFGTDSSQSYLLDPLAFAAEQAWNQGIVVVASVGNLGTTAGHVSDPGSDPYVIAVGAVDTQGSLSTDQHNVASFSSRGDGVRNPDVVAPGVHVASLRDPGSVLDTTFGATADVGSRFFRGTGTSQATAAVSGAAALIISQHPEYSPDQVKYVLTHSASRLEDQGSVAQGRGEINLRSALSTRAPIQWLAAQRFLPATGLGSLQAARGSLTLTANGVTLAGELDVMGKPFNSAAMAALEAGGVSWVGGSWNGSGWSGSGWSGSGWSGSGWSGSGWSGSGWSGSGWSGSGWSGSGWSGSGWSGSGWSGSGWSGSGWSGAYWS